MFDSVLRPGQLPRQSYGSGTIVAIALHGAIGAVAIAISVHTASMKKKDPIVIFPRQPTRATSAPPLPLPTTPAHQSRKPTGATSRVITAPKTIPNDQPRESDTSPLAQSTEPDGEEDTSPLPNGSTDVSGGEGSSPWTPPKRIRLDDSVRLNRISGPRIEYTAEALEHEIQGTMVVQCLVTTTGAVRDCRILKSLPFMDRAVRETLEKWRYQPYSIDGEPVEVEYEFKIRLEMP